MPPLLSGEALAVRFVFKQKTAYEIYRCDWSSDVCSSDLQILYHKYYGLETICPTILTEQAVFRALSKYCLLYTSPLTSCASFAFTS